MLSRSYMASEMALKTLSWFIFLLIGITLSGLLLHLFYNGLPTMSWDFLTSVPEKAGRAGGIGPIIVSTFYIVGLAMVVALPIGLSSALLISEFSRAGSNFAFFVRKSLDVLAGVPSIVFGLFGNAFFCVYLEMGFSIVSGALTLSCMVLPILIRILEESLRAVPNEYRFGLAALGFSKTASVWHILLPVAAPGLVVGTVLGFGRAIAETAALIFTSGYVDRWPESLMDSGRALSVHIFDLSMNIPGGDQNAYGAGLTLVVIIISITGLTSYLSNQYLKSRGIQQ